MADEFNIPGWDVPADGGLKPLTIGQVVADMVRLGAGVDPTALTCGYYRHDLADVITAIRDAGRPVGWTRDGNLLRWGEPEPSDAAEPVETSETLGGLTDRAPERRPDTHVWRNFFIPAGSCGWPAGGSGRMLVDRRTWDACIGNGTPEVEPSEVVETEPARLRLTFEPGVRVEAAPGAAVGIEEHDEVEGWCPVYTDGPLVVERVARDPDGRTVLELVEAADGGEDDA